MLFRIGSLILMLANPIARASNCTSGLSDEWVIGTTITQITIAALQVVGASASYFGDLFFYKKRLNQTTIDLQ